MEDKKNFDIEMDDDSGDENKKLVDKFLTVKALLDEDKRTQHFEKMLEAFRKAEVEENMNYRELSDEEIDFVAAAGAEARLQERFWCKKCQKVFKTYLELEKHQRDNICGVRG